MDKKEIEITVDKNNKVDLHDFIEMKIKYDVEYQKKDKEIERLNNIIKELEIYINKTIIDGGTRGSMTFWYRQIYDYLQELKGDGSNETFK